MAKAPANLRLDRLEIIEDGAVNLVLAVVRIDGEQNRAALRLPSPPSKFHGAFGICSALLPGKV